MRYNWHINLCRFKVYLVFLPGESPWQRSLVGYSPWGCKESYTTQWLSTTQHRVYTWASEMALVVKNLPASAGDLRDAGSIPRSGRSPGEGNGNPLQQSCLENSMDGGAWWATVHGVTKSRTQWSDFTSLLLQRNFPSQGSNPGLLPHRQALYHLSYTCWHLGKRKRVNMENGS